jgi:hypothetical protein
VFAICFVQIHAIESHDRKGEDHLKNAKERMGDVCHRELDIWFEPHFRGVSLVLEVGIAICCTMKLKEEEGWK